jgi:ankyrin repeat protein
MRKLNTRNNWVRTRFYTNYTNYINRELSPIKVNSGILKGPFITVLLNPMVAVETNEIKLINTTLHYAASTNQIELVRELLYGNADVNEKDSTGKTPLMWASENGFAEIASFLLENNADVNLCDHYGRTALHWASGASDKDEQTDKQTAT